MPVAGATDFLIDARFKGLRPRYIVDLNPLPLRYIREERGYLALGALTTMRQIETSPLLRGKYEALAEAAAQVGSLQVRNLATLGGNLALEAEVVLAGPRGERVVPLEGFFLGPGETVREPDEVLTEVRVPLQEGRVGTAYLRASVREALDIAIVNVACLVALDGEGRIGRARVALGAVAPTPIRAREAEEALRGQAPAEALWERAGHLAAEATRPISDVRASAQYRRAMAGHYTRLALAAATQRAREGQG